MCVLTYTPFPENGILLTSNRDESPKRKPAIFPEKQMLNHNTIIYPKDTEKGGTWFAASSEGSTICLLNGAFEPHDPQPPYRKSRGMVVLEAFNYPDFDTFQEQFDFEGIEPFTVVSLNLKQQALTLQELRWDGKNLYKSSFNAQEPHIWSSASLYSAEAHQKRKALFHEQLNQNDSMSSHELLTLHKSFKMGQFPEDYLADGNLPPVETLSTIQLISENSRQAKIQYTSLKNGGHTKQTIVKKA